MFDAHLLGGCIAQPGEGRKNMEVMLAILAAKGACGSGVSLILWVIAAVLVIGGIVTLIRGGVLAGIAMIVIGLLIGPGGVSIFC
jgi:hypothetical protein